MADPRGGLTDVEPVVAEQLLAAAPTPLLAVDAEDRVRQVNAAAEAMINVSRAAMLGRPLADFVGQAVPDGAPVVAYDRVVARDGTRRQTADLLAAAWPERPGWRVVAIHPRPGTPLARSGDTVGRSAAGAAAMLAHEIKNPLSGIRGAAQLLETALDRDGRAMTTLIREEVDRIAGLIDRMEHFTDSRPLTPAAVNIHEVLNHVRRLIEPGLPAGVVVREDYDPSLPEVLGERDALIQVFLNLLKNATEAVDGKAGTIRLTTAFRAGLHRRDGGDGRRHALPIEICVIDDGPGAPAEIADHLFEPFVTAKPSGRGLGLTLVQKLVGDLRGLIEYSREGQPERTVFRVLLGRAGSPG